MTGDVHLALPHLSPTARHPQYTCSAVLYIHRTNSSHTARVSNTLQCGLCSFRTAFWLAIHNPPRHIFTVSPRRLTGCTILQQSLMARPSNWITQHSPVLWQIRKTVRRHSKLNYTCRVLQTLKTKRLLHPENFARFITSSQWRDTVFPKSTNRLIL
jgi:hypothetical protein